MKYWVIVYDDQMFYYYIVIYFLVISLAWYKEYIICLVSFSKFSGMVLHVQVLYYQKYLFFFSSSSFFFGQVLLSNCTIFSKRLLRSISALSILLFTSINIVTERSYHFKLLEIMYVILKTFLPNFIFSLFNFVYLIFNFTTSCFFLKIPSLDFSSGLSSGFKAFKASTCFIPWSLIFLAFQMFYWVGNM